MKGLCKLLCTSRRSKPITATIRNDPGRCTAAQRGRYVPLSTRSGKLISADPSRPDRQFEVFGTLQLSCCWSLTALATYWQIFDRTCRDRSRSVAALHNHRPNVDECPLLTQSGHRPAKFVVTQTADFCQNRIDWADGIRGYTAGPAERLHQSSDAVVCFALQSLGLVGIR